MTVIPLTPVLPPRPFGKQNHLALDRVKLIKSHFIHSHWVKRDIDFQWIQRLLNAVKCTFRLTFLFLSSLLTLPTVRTVSGRLRG